MIVDFSIEPMYKETVWVLFSGLNREAGERPAWSRRCNRGRNPQKKSHWVLLGAWEGVGSRESRESEDLPIWLLAVWRGSAGKRGVGRRKKAGCSP